jgi:hypothetical protein
MLKIARTIFQIILVIMVVLEFITDNFKVILPTLMFIFGVWALVEGIYKLKEKSKTKGSLYVFASVIFFLGIFHYHYCI